MTTRIIVFVVLELLLLYALFGGWLIRKLSPEKRRLRLLCRDYATHLRRVIRHDRDLLTPAAALSLRELGRQARDISRARQMTDAEIRLQMHEIEQQGQQLLAYRQSGSAWIRETLEVMVVALSVAFAFRALFFQPFKIPTGSMEPTLYGVHFVEREAMRPPSLPRQAIDFMHFSNRYVNQSIQRPGRYQGFRPARGLPFLNSTVIRIAGLEYTLPGDLEAVRKQAPQIWRYERHRAEYLSRLAQEQPFPPRNLCTLTETKFWHVDTCAPETMFLSIASSIISPKSTAETLWSF